MKRTGALVTAVPAQGATRLTGLYRLRVALTVGVIATHAIITCSANGSWFYQDGQLPRAVDMVAGVPFVLRTRFLIDTYHIGAAHLWQWGQCAGLFVLGTIAGREGWLTTIPRRSRGLPTPGIVTLMILLPSAVVSSFALAQLMRRVPGMRQILR